MDQMRLSGSSEQIGPQILDVVSQVPYAEYMQVPEASVLMNSF